MLVLFEGVENLHFFILSFSLDLFVKILFENFCSFLVKVPYFFIGRLISLGVATVTGNMWHLSVNQNSSLLQLFTLLGLNSLDAIYAHSLICLSLVVVKLSFIKALV